MWPMSRRTTSWPPTAPPSTRGNGQDTPPQLYMRQARGRGKEGMGVGWIDMEWPCVVCVGWRRARMSCRSRGNACPTASSRHTGEPSLPTVTVHPSAIYVIYKSHLSMARAGRLQHGSGVLNGMIWMSCSGLTGSWRSRTARSWPWRVSCNGRPPTWPPSSDRWSLSRASSPQPSDDSTPMTTR